MILGTTLLTMEEYEEYELGNNSIDDYNNRELSVAILEDTGSSFGTGSGTHSSILSMKGLTLSTKLGFCNGTDRREVPRLAQ